jgi:hypothetical protein
MTTVAGHIDADITIDEMSRNELRKRLRRLRLRTKGRLHALKVRLALWRLAHPDSAA